MTENTYEKKKNKKKKTWSSNISNIMLDINWKDTFDIPHKLHGEHNRMDTCFLK